MAKTIFITPKAITKVLLGIVSFLLALHFICIFLRFGLGRTRIFDFIEVFYFDKPINAQAYYSSIAMVLSAGLLWLIGNLKSEREKKLVLFWKALSMVFLFLSIDELISIHENLGRLGKSLIGDSSLGGGYFYFAWYVPYVLLFGIIALFFVRSFFKLPYQFRVLFIIAGTVFISGAVGMEMLCSKYYFTNKVFDLNYVLLLTVEELLEMLGIIVFIHALTTYYLLHTKVYVKVANEFKMEEKIMHHSS